MTYNVLPLTKMHFIVQVGVFATVFSAVIIGSSAQLKFEEDVKICIFLGTTTYLSRKLSDFNVTLQDSNFNIYRPTVLYVHGFNEGPHSNAVRTVYNAYKKKGGYNFLVLDWSLFSIPDYFLVAIANLYKIGDLVAKYLLEFINAGYPVGRLHLIGNSLGGQMIGKIGRKIISITAGTTSLPRLTALDPSGPGFYAPVIANEKAISSSDATFVDVIHTDAFNLGTIFKCGHVDFYVNEGKAYQPGCFSEPFINSQLSNACSHYRAWRFYSESVLNTTAFPGVECNSWSDFVFNPQGCFRMTRGYMGLGAFKGLRGNYYLQTEGRPLFGRGEEGLWFNINII